MYLPHGTLLITRHCHPGPSCSIFIFCVSEETVPKATFKLWSSTPTSAQIAFALTCPSFASSCSSSPPYTIFIQFHTRVTEKVSFSSPLLFTGLLPECVYLKVSFNKSIHRFYIHQIPMLIDMQCCYHPQTSQSKLPTSSPLHQTEYITISAHSLFIISIASPLHIDSQIYAHTVKLPVRAEHCRLRGLLTTQGVSAYNSGVPWLLLVNTSASDSESMKYDTIFNNTDSSDKEVPSMHLSCPQESLFLTLHDRPEESNSSEQLS